MKVFGIAGWSGSGKTTMLARTIPEIIARGLKVSTIKHAHHAFDIDQPGKDSHRHRVAGASEVMISSGKRWALMHELREEPEPTLAELLQRLSPVDLVLVEGFKFYPHAKLEVYRAEIGKPLLARNDPHIIGIATDKPLPDIKLPQMALDDASAIADFIIRHCAVAEIDA